jgi:hypothetical protein
MAEPIDDMIAELDAFEPSDDAADNDERLQIWVDRWAETPDKDNALSAMFALFERYPETTLLGDHGEPGPILHSIEQIPGYEQALAESLQRMPSYYGVCMIKRILDLDVTKEVRDYWLATLRTLAQDENVSPVVSGYAQEILAFE